MHPNQRAGDDSNLGGGGKSCVGSLVNSNDIGSGLTAPKTTAIPLGQPTGSKRGFLSHRAKRIFFEQLRSVLSDKKLSHAISWDGKRKRLAINPTPFVEDVLEKRFVSVKLGSFQRRLNRWGFVCVQNSSDGILVYRNESFHLHDKSTTNTDPQMKRRRMHPVLPVHKTRALAKHKHAKKVILTLEQQRRVHQDQSQLLQRRIENGTRAEFYEAKVNRMARERVAEILARKEADSRAKALLDHISQRRRSSTRLESVLRAAEEDRAIRASRELERVSTERDIFEALRCSVDRTLTRSLLSSSYDTGEVASAVSSVAASYTNTPNHHPHPCNQSNTSGSRLLPFHASHRHSVVEAGRLEPTPDQFRMLLLTEQSRKLGL